jgi:hypothetical protein
VREGGSTCNLCESGHYCLGSDFFKTKCANSDSPAGSASRAACVCAAGFGGKTGICMDCNRKACESGNYTVGCGGSSEGTCQVCGACNNGFFREGCLRGQEGVCKVCPVNQYAVGTSFRTGCKSCDSVCASGQYVVGCGGVTQGTCVSCNTTCPPGQHLAGTCSCWCSMVLYVWLCVVYVFHLLVVTGVASGDCVYLVDLSSSSSCADTCASSAGVALQDAEESAQARARHAHHALPTSTRWGARRRSGERASHARPCALQGSMSSAAGARCRGRVWCAKRVRGDSIWLVGCIFVGVDKCCL